jgi:hypothetical protein
LLLPVKEKKGLRIIRKGHSHRTSYDGFAVALLICRLVHNWLAGISAA